VDAGKFRICPSSDDPHNEIAPHETFHCAADFDNLSGELQAKQGRIPKIGPIAVCTLSLQQVSPVHTSGRDSDQQIGWSNQRRVNIRYAQHLSVSWLVKHDGLQSCSFGALKQTVGARLL
jgi:hypothetical protein